MISYFSALPSIHCHCTTYIAVTSFYSQIVSFNIFKPGTDIEAAVLYLKSSMPDLIEPAKMPLVRKWQLYNDIRPFVYLREGEDDSLKDMV